MFAFLVLGSRGSWRLISEGTPTGSPFRQRMVWTMKGSYPKGAGAITARQLVEDHPQSRAVPAGTFLGSPRVGVEQRELLYRLVANVAQS
jgi:hypothetical protein